MARWSDASVRAALDARRQVSRYPFPGASSLTVGVKLLTDSELDAVRLQAAEFVKKNRVDLAIDPEFMDRAIHRETISRAFVDPDQPDVPFFGSQGDVAELDNLTVRALYELYIVHHQSMDPYAFASAEDVQKLVDALGKSESSAAALLSSFDFVTLRSFAISMASLLRETQRSPKSST